MKDLRIRKLGAMLSLFATAGLLVNTGKAQTTTTTTTTTPTTAQVTTPAAVPATGDQAMAMEKFEVTGSYLPTSALVSASPVTVVDSTQVEGFGDTNILESLKRLDVAFTGNGNLGTEANNVGDGGGGESYVALRNLTTLVLMDGHRLPVSAFSGFGGANSVDVGIIPLMMIDHIDVLKDGASTVYGSDAIGGVVNIITKKNFSGVEVYGGYGSTSGGDFYTHNYGVVGGVSTDNAWITFDANDSVSSELTTLARGITTLSDAQQAAINFQPGATGDAYYSGSFPGRVASDTLAGAPEAIGAPGYNAAITSPPMWSEPSAIVPQTLAQLEAKGIYIPLSSTPAYVAAGNSTALLNTADFNNASIIPNDRRQFLLNGDDKIFGDSLEFSTQILYSQSINGGDTLAPSPLASLTGNNLSIPANNPYNPFGVLLGVGEASGAPGIRTRLIEVGHRTATNTTDTYEATFELKGKVNDALHWDTWLDYSRSNWLENVYGGANGSVLNQVLTPLLDANGNYVLNSAGLPLSVFADPATGNQDIPVYNYFGLPGSNSPATIKAIETTLFQSGVSELKNYHFIVSGDVLSLPGGDLTYSAGYEYLRQDLAYQVDGLFANGLALGYSAASSFAGGTIYTNGFFAELGLPLTQPSLKIPGFYEADVTLAGREEKLSTGPSSTVPKIGVHWQPFDDELTIRATYSHGFVSPSVFSLFGPPDSGAPTFTVIEGNGQSNAGGALPGLPKVSGQFLQGFGTTLANPNLAPSKAKTWTLGAVYSPKWAKGLDLSVDYYHVDETNVGTTDFTGIVTSLNALGSASPYAKDFNFADGSVLTSTAPNQVTSTNAGNINVPLTETGSQWTDGLDIDVDYTFLVPMDWGRVKTGVNGTILFNYYGANNASSPLLQYARQFTSGANSPFPNGTLPGWIYKPYIDWSLGGLTVSVDAQIMDSLTDSGSLFGDTTPGDTNSETLNGAKYNIPVYTTADVSATYSFGSGLGNNDFINEILKNSSVTVGITDFTNKLPPPIPSSEEDNTDKVAYNIIGRFFFVQATKKF